MPASPQPAPVLRPGSEGITQGMLLGMVLCSYFSIALMQILLGLAFLNWGWGLFRPGDHCGRPTVRAPLALPMAGFVAVSALSALLARDAHGIKESLSGGMPLLVYLVTLNVMAAPPRLRRCVWFVVAGGALAAILGLLQAAFEARGFRIAGSLSHYMTFSGVLMLAAMVALARLVFGASGRERLVLVFSLLAIGAALLLTQTRGSWLGVAAGSVVVLALRQWRLLPLLPIAVGIAYLLAPGHVQDRILSTFDLTDKTVSQREVMWRVGAEIVAEHPLLGIGPRRTDEYYGDHRPEDDPYAGQNPPGHLHNNVVQTAAERGLVGLLLWLAIWILWFFLAGRVWKSLGPEASLERAVVAGSLAALTAFQTMGFFEYNAGDSEVATLALFITAWPFAVRGIRSGEAEV